DGAALRRLAEQRPAHQAILETSDIDGIPMDEDIDGVPLEGEAEGDVEGGERSVAGFVPSRWESVEPAMPVTEAVREPTPPPPPEG
ncbi:jg25244, partial [Pararge aegeria aegeria]